MIIVNSVEMIAILNSVCDVLSESTTFQTLDVW